MAVARLFSIVILVVATMVIGVLFYQVMASFFVPLFLAALLVVIFRPTYHWIFTRVKGRPRLAAALTTILILLLVLMPAAMIIFVAVDQGKRLVFRLRTGGVMESIDRMRTGLALDLPTSESFRKLNEDFVAVATPMPTVAVKNRIREAGDILHFIQGEVTASEPTELLYEELLADLATLSERAEGFAMLEDSDDSVGRERARRDYENQWVRTNQSRSEWTSATLGNSYTSRLKLWVNPSESEIKRWIDAAQDYLTPRVLPLTQLAGQFVFQTLLFVLILAASLYFFLADGTLMVNTMMRLSPLDNQYERRLLLEFDQISRAVVLASVLSALAQGILAVIAFWFAGLEMLVLLFIATSFMALVPFLGAASIWVPCAIYLATVEHRIGAAIGLALFGAAVISTIDNVIKIYVLQGRSQLHPLLALLSVLGGLQVFGPIGILVGPMVVVFLQTLLEILNHELEGKGASDVQPT